VKRTIIASALIALWAASSYAITIFPIDRAEILAGSRFDFKVELDGVVAEKDVSVTVTLAGTTADYGKVFGRKAEYLEKEKDVEASALLLRDLTLAKAGKYTVSATDGKSTKTVAWTVYAPAAKPVAKNVIFLLGDGLSVGHTTAARLMSKGNTEGKTNALMNYDLMDRVGMVGTSSVDSIAVDSANSMSAYMTGHKSSVNAIGVYADRTRDPFDDPRQETIGELVRRATKKSIGIVSDAELEDATPAAVVSHTRLRAEKAAIVKFFYDVKPEVLLGGGAAYFIPQSVTGSKRKDDLDYVELFSKAGYSLATTATELSQVMAAKPRKLLGLFHPENLDGVMDRKIFTSANTVPDFPDQPDLTDMTKAALDILSRNKEGFVLMVEAGLIDKFTHPMDWERAVYDTIMFDKVIGIAQEFAKKNLDTLIIVTGDHTHSISVYGTVNDNLKPGSPLRDKVGTYAAAGFPSYQDADQDGYPDTPAVPKRLAVGFGNHPDYWENFLPKLDATFAPTVKNDKNEYVANEKYKTDEAVLIAGNLARTLDATEVHSVDDMTLRASGPGSEKLKAYQENTSIFRYMVEALGIFSPKPKQ
jgi:alkaline phosphatase